MLKELKDTLLKTKKRIIISTHVNPDGDAIGSEIALANTLKKLGKNVSILNQDPTPLQFKFLEKYFDSYAIENISNKEPVLVILLDVNDINDIGKNIKMFLTEELHEPEIVVIDHHAPNTINKNYKYIVDEGRSSTGEIIYNLIKNELGITPDKETAEAIYTAIVSDTKSFRYSRTTVAAHYIAAELMHLGIDHEKIQTEIFGSNSIGQICLLGYALSNIKLSDNKKIAYTVLTLDELKRCSVLAPETKGFINHLLTIKDVEVAVLFRQDKENLTKISIRSKGNYPIHDLAVKLGGGGHKFAATFSCEGKPSSCIEKVISGLEELTKGTPIK